MNIFSKILAVRDVINAGEQLSKPEVWANVTACTGALVVVMNAAKSFVPELEVVDEDTFRKIAEGCFYLWSVISIWVHPATVKDAGLPTKRRNH